MIALLRGVREKRAALVKGFYLRRLVWWPVLTVLVFLVGAFLLPSVYVPGAGLVCIAGGEKYAYVVSRDSKCVQGSPGCVDPGIFCTESDVTCPVRLDDEAATLAMWLSSALLALGIWSVIFVGQSLSISIRNSTDLEIKLRNILYG